MVRMMTVAELCQKAELKAIVCPDPSREIEGAYCGDLLSWVMGRAKSGDAWITIMSNINILAVATLADVSCVLLAEGVTPDEELIKTAKQKGINILASSKTSFELAKLVGALI